MSQATGYATAGSMLGPLEIPSRVLVEPRHRHPWLTAAGFVLLGYAVMGKGAGYIGVPPVFIGEFLLLGGIASLFVNGKFRNLPLPTMLCWVIVFCAWAALRTIPYVSAYGVDALRDAVIWGYSAFAFVWFYYLLSEPQRFAALLSNYQKFAVLALIGMPAAWLARFLLGDSTPSWPWADTKVIDLKAGDVMVHLSGIFAFWVSRPKAKVNPVLLLIFALCAAVMSAYERAGMFAFGLVFFVCLLMRPGHHAIRGLATLGFVAMAALAFSGVKLEVPTTETTKTREISFAQFVDNVSSAIAPSNMGDLDDTKEWRLQWWTEITHYTLKGPYFWTGKGFGINLADDDGFQVMDDHSLRSPHNGHLMILARAGVPGLALWLILQLGWAATIAGALRRSVRDGQHDWAGVFLLLFCYWIALVVNGAFDVYLEGPMGGIWFWSVYGIGLAAVFIWRHYPELLSEHENPYRA